MPPTFNITNDILKNANNKLKEAEINQEQSQIQLLNNNQHDNEQIQLPDDSFSKTQQIQSQDNEQIVNTYLNNELYKNVLDKYNSSSQSQIQSQDNEQNN